MLHRAAESKVEAASVAMEWEKIGGCIKKMRADC
jgi:hypothetical protein